MNFFLKQMMKKQLKQLPKDQQEKIMAAFEKDPEFFKNLATDIQAKIKEGKDQQTAAMEVMMSHQEKLADLLK
jgi:mRNA-degrading endonuclease RelE of RelBE toxin-antitoxin system